MAVHQHWRRGGYLRVGDPDGGSRHYEADTFTCRHCNRIVEVPPFASPTDSGSRCSGCDSLICAPCARRKRCLPREEWCLRVERRAREIEARQEFRRDLRRAG